MKYGTCARLARTALFCATATLAIEMLPSARAAPTLARSTSKAVGLASLASRPGWTADLPKTLDDILRCYQALPSYITSAWVQSTGIDETNIVTVEMTAGTEPKFLPIRCTIQDKDGFAREAAIEVGDYQHNLSSPPPYFAREVRDFPRGATFSTVEIKDSFGRSRGYLGFSK